MHEQQEENLPPDQVLEAVAFVGDTLAPFFLNEPQSEEMQPVVEAWSAADPTALAQDWPFVPCEVAQRALPSMVEGLAGGASRALIDEYRRLFVGPGKKAAPPWGSVYTDWEGAIFGASTLALRQWMRQNGIELHLEEHVPEDHIGLMLAMMAWIAKHQPENLADYLQYHLLTWSSHYLDQLHDAAEHPFYRALAELTRATLEGIQAELHISVEYPRFFR